MEISPETLATWRSHLRDEVDAAYLYGHLAVAEPDPKRKRIYEGLVSVEQRHAAMWEDLLKKNGVEVTIPPPSLRARVLAWVAQRFGPGVLLTALLREEGQEVKGYLNLHRDSKGEAKAAALQLAQESAEHARVLQKVAGQENEAWHSMASGGLLRNIVYGFNDGLTANFGLIAGVFGADVSANFVVLSGFSGAVADALSMGSSGYLAAKSEREVYEHEIAMEREEIRLMPELEQEELTLIYQAKGMTEEQASALAAEIIRSPEKALDEMVREELKIGADYSSPMGEALVTGIATIIGALIPVAPFFVLPGHVAAWTSFVIAMLAHFAVGAARSVFTGRGIFRSGIDMFLVGLGVAIVGYLAGDLLMKLLPS